jgi:adenylate cyclase
MRFRIGVHLGDVIEKSDGTVYGDGVNIAARLQSLADAGGITVSESIRTAVKGRQYGAGFEDLGEQQVRNIADPVRAWRVHPGGPHRSDRPRCSRCSARPSLLAPWAWACAFPTGHRSWCCPSP